MQVERVSNPVQPSLAIIIAIISIMFSVTILMVAYGKFCDTTRPVLSGPRHTFRDLVRSRSRCSGIDKAVIETLPFFRFSSLKGSREGLECSVCPLKFEDSEVLRLLPKCRHAFHMDCIDKWQESHCSCPLCRWSDVNPSDLMLLKSEMLNIILSKRLSPLNSSVEFHHGFSMNEQIVKIKEDLDTKRLYEFKVGKIKMSYSISTSSFPLDSKNEGNQTASSRLLIPAQNRSLSEITNISRFREFRTRNRIIEGNNGRDEKMRRLWLKIVRHTVEWFAGRERNSESKRKPSNL
ncbi:E3 ubiquitin-protein ligase ATL42-like [Diospyros lotus]|uniref:E3 ubiquitin-protein ligase ATL42-like n=1 Tax=Diospyros lotus TaxID=55363 RepID=UPI00224EEE9D|nr:E3 ubiquitin-protein ligase ATL42-like [Diospyros lotus]